MASAEYEPCEEPSDWLLAVMRSEPDCGECENTGLTGEGRLCTCAASDALVGEIVGAAR